MSARFLIHDRDATFAAAFDTIVTSEDVTIMHTPVRSPNANAVGERWIRSGRDECLDKVFLHGEGHLSQPGAEHNNLRRRAHQPTGWTVLPCAAVPVCAHR